jgi:EAL domain-containing protein (putative c-di-GMP-specific phosphodiesterase class I)
VIAERIETPRHAEMARDAGAWYLQGFWCDRMAAQQCETLDVEPLAPVFA